MILSDDDIQACIDAGRIGVTPYDSRLLQPASLDVRLDRHFLIRTGTRRIDPAVDDSASWEPVDVFEGQTFTLEPGGFALASTWETVRLPHNIAARVEGKSSLGRMGLLTHVTAGFIDPGFHGQITLELANVSNATITLYPGMRIGQVCFMHLTSPAVAPYGVCGNHYQGQRGPVPSRAWQNFTTTNIYKEQ